MGLIVLILVGIVPTAFALNMGASADSLQHLSSAAVVFSQSLEQQPRAAAAAAGADAAHRQLTHYLRAGRMTDTTIAARALANHRVVEGLNGVRELSTVPATQRRSLRLDIYLVSETMARTIKAKQLPATLDATAAASYQKSLKGLTN